MESLKVVFIGSGNVATNLSYALHKAGVNVLQIFSLKYENARFLAQKIESDYTNDFTKLNCNADIYFISVNDDAISDLLKNISLKNKVLVHTSGSIDIEILKETTDNYGVFYPLQSFTKEKLLSFDDIPLCLEASNSYTLSQIKKLAYLISNNVYDIDTKHRKILHLSAVFASNFTNFMYISAEEIIKKEGLDFKVLLPLIKQTAIRISDNSPYEMMTGPAKRKDMKIINIQLELLDNYPEFKEIYKILTEKIMSKYN